MAAGLPIQVNMACCIRPPTPSLAVPYFECTLLYTAYEINHYRTPHSSWLVRIRSYAHGSRLCTLQPCPCPCCTAYHVWCRRQATLIAGRRPREVCGKTHGAQRPARAVNCFERNHQLSSFSVFPTPSKFQCPRLLPVAVAYEHPIRIV
jgi:hypothetical protein